MRKKILPIFVLLCSFISTAQITLEKTVLKNERVNFVKIDDDLKYFILDLDSLVMTIYNSDHSLHKTITTDLDNLGFVYDINDYYLQDFFPVICLSSNVFDADSELEFLLFLYGDNSKILIVNEDGSVIFDTENKRPHFREVYDPQNPSWIKNTSEGIKMILKDQNSAENQKYIYSLPGTAVLSTLEFELNSFKLNAYPNPGLDFINLEYKLPENVSKGYVLIYDLNGREIKKYAVDTHVTALRISTNSLASGTYLYTVEAGNYKSKPLKIVIK